MSKTEKCVKKSTSSVASYSGSDRTGSDVEKIKVVNILRNIWNEKICKKITSSVASYIGSDRTGSDVEK